MSSSAPPSPPQSSPSVSKSGSMVDSRSSELLISTIVTTSCAIAIVLGRLYTRLALTRNLGWDDIFLAISSILGIALTALIGVLAKYGVGKHVQNVPFSNAHWIHVLGFCVRMIHIVVLTTTKVSVCLFYRRIFQDSLGKILSVTLMAFMTVFTVVLFIVGFFACDLGGAYWSPAGARCADPSFLKHTGFFVYGSATLSVVMDLLLMAFALWRVFPLAIARAQKISLYAIISLGWLAIIASIIRAIRTGQTFDSTDPTWAAYDIDIWASVEVNTGLVCASAPALKPLIRQLFPGFLASISERTSGRNNNVCLNENGYFRATSHGSQGGQVELVGRSQNTSATRMTQKELHFGGSDEVRIDEEMVRVQTRERDIESETDILDDDFRH